MYSGVQLGWRYLRYYFTASNGKGHGIHSPFVFDFVTKVLNDDRHFYAYTSVENLRKFLLADPRVNHIAKTIQPAKYSQLLFRTTAYYAPEKILEIGTSLGIITAYLASANTAHVITVEESVEAAKSAKANLAKLHLDNVKSVMGNCDEVLPGIMREVEKVDMVFFSKKYIPRAMHYYQQIKPRLHENTILVFEDIHVSKEMEQAWEEIRQQQEVTLTIDLFHNGFVFFRKENKAKQHFSIRF